jgi:hypothetical protein
MILLALVESIVSDFVILRQSEAENHLIKLEKFNKKNDKLSRALAEVKQ